ncbi:helix-turn-helix domain-containing protein [Nonomuraea cavernae]|uniref:Transcriptional regulator n=1 Tax=Nonomuraea cavernae TaxID=2045107 RepID=A0A918DV96_9ACTN|nr:helix-turn-helix transcriptional regulator [Nonomuraea cavernae]MCA2188347.1 helix-turn-helix domain-containing protein [Nonomuraea cavernae]GGO83565.1 transcriptional regulator [Nonomuraea cavernae]
MANPTLRQRQLAKRLRELRLEAGLSIAEVSEHILCSPAKISRIETAQRRVSLRDVRDLCKLYGIDDATQLMALAKDAREQSWWQQGEGVDIGPLIGLENEASTITEYETTTIPGLLQTEEYARAVTRGFVPRIDETLLSRKIEVRMKRQELLHRAGPPHYWVLLDESALHRHIGGAGVMKDQLERLLQMAELPHVTIQVIPYTVGAHMGFDSAFMLLEFDEDTHLSDTVFMETIAGHIFEEKAKHLARFREIVDHLRAVALNPQASSALISHQQGQFASQVG